MSLFCCRPTNFDRSSSIMSLSSYTTSSSAKTWGYPLYLCDCCPYGYHIDLDFVRYCESISKEADRTGSVKRRKDRRRQRKSMEVLLGLSTISEQSYAKPSEPISPIVEAENRLLQKQDSFDNVIDDFEKTFQRSKNKLSNNLPDVTAVSDMRRTTPIVAETGTTLAGSITMKKFTHKEIESSNDYCPTTFKNIREQMALSLERTRQLEEQNKQLPELKVQISALKDENERLLRKLKLQEEMKQNTMNSNYLESSYKQTNKFYSLPKIDTHQQNGMKELNLPLSTKDIGVTCSVLTRNVGVGHQTPSRKNASTETSIDSSFADKWFGEKLKFINDQNELKKSINETLNKVPNITKGNQTLSIKTFSQSTQTIEIPIPKKIVTDKQTQTVCSSTSQKHQSVLVKPVMKDFNVQKSIEVYNIGVSDDTITDINCEKCNVAKISVAVGADKNEDAHLAPVSLQSLSFPRSKSFNLGEDKINLNVRNRSVAIQYQYKPAISTKSSQYESSNISRSCQSSIKTHTRSSQHESKLVETSTQSEESIFRTPKKVQRKDVSCEAKERKLQTQSIGCNTTWAIPTTTVCTKCQNKEKEDEDQKKSNRHVTVENIACEDDIKRKDETASVSRIPRLLLTPTSERRKFKRQDTYTKINASPPSEENYVGLSGLDLSSKASTTTTSPFDKVKENLRFPAATKDIQNQNEVSRQTSKSTLTSVTPSSSTPFVPTSLPKQRKKAVPTREMQGAMKVLNDSLLKQTKLPKSHKAIDIIQQEWFKISGLISANPLDVEDYLDAFEDMSSMLLDYIVNMTDTSGNTAMHYAVSHGNFDVVSILLDSKVCDINKPNNAGYTSVMLVSLADIRSPTHANVVRRLFQMADVNIRAKQHGQTSLMLAVSHGRLDMVEMLLEAGADINIQDDDGSTALMCAAEHGHIEIVKHFLSQPDCDSTITDVDGSTALKIAMEAKHRPIGVLLYTHERNLIAHGHKHKKKTSNPKPPSSPLSTRHSLSALNDINSSK
ncbi:hypothetical protein HHI36_022982 [Cryptolaemus montrouzieri]|uniref:KN motif and ankyrin repeat domain-containing protein 1 n=1 Tax=Cryptolaemus montrouzieri TaxID=559131 RepID=A0ABD2PFY4_9CUCU